MNTDNKRLRRCCFTGHRPEKLLKSETDISRVEAKIKSLLRPAVASAIQDGYITFLSGMARGFDLWAADVVLEARAHNPEIHLICALPLIDFEKKWAPAEQEHYNSILRQADYVKLVSKNYYSRCFQVRNEYMVDNSARVIAAYNGIYGGTRNTINYAHTRNVDVVNLLESELL